MKIARNYDGIIKDRSSSDYKNSLSYILRWQFRVNAVLGKQAKVKELEERRHWPRYNVEWPIKVEGVGESAGNGAETGKLNNISAKGALVSIERKFDVGARISLFVKLPSPADAWIGFSGYVVRVEKGPEGVDTALRFDTSRPIFADL